MTDKVLCDGCHRYVKDAELWWFRGMEMHECSDCKAQRPPLRKPPKWSAEVERLYADHEMRGWDS